MEMRLSLMCSLVIALLNCISSQAQSDLCVSYPIEDIETCSSTSIWAVNTPNLTINHNITTSAALPYSITYVLEFNGSSNGLCSYFYDGSSCVLGSSTEFCLSCAASKNADGSTLLDIEFFISTIASGSVIKYTLPATSDYGKIIQQLSTSVCPLEVTNSTAFPDSGEPCGYGCERNFKCLPDYQNISYYDFTTIHRCNAAADWDKPPPQCFESPPEVTTTATMLVTTTNKESSEPSTTIVNPTIFISSSSYNTSISANITGSLKRSSQEISAITITSIGCISMTFYGGTTGYALISKIIVENVKFLHIGKGISVIAWSISVGVLFGIPDNNAAYIAGTTIGSLSLVGKTAVIYLLTSAIYNYKPEIKSTPGKKENRTTTDRIDL